MKSPPRPPRDSLHQRRLVLLRRGQTLRREVDREAEQLKFPFVDLPTSVLISLGYEGCSFDDFDYLIRRCQPRTLIDVRISPSFTTRGFTPDAVIHTLTECGVSYHYASQLGNRFISDHWDPAASLETMRKYLAQHAHLLDWLRGSLREGRVVLMGRSPNHHESERAVIVEELVRLEPDVLCIAAESVLRGRVPRARL